MKLTATRIFLDIIALASIGTPTQTKIDEKNKRRKLIENVKGKKKNPNPKRSGYILRNSIVKSSAIDLVRSVEYRCVYGEFKSNNTSTRMKQKRNALRALCM